MSSSADRIAGLSEDQKRALLAQLLQKKAGLGAAAASPTVVVPDPNQRFEPFPLTDIQQAYWIGRTDAFDLGGVGTHIYLEIETPELDLERLNHAWQRLIDRHDMLRAVVLPDGRQQFLREVPAYQIGVEDVRGFSQEAVQAAIQRNRARMSHQVFRVDRWPMFELFAFRLPQGRHLYCLGFDMMIADLHSLDILLREWFLLYIDPGATMPPLAISFRDYVLTEIAHRDSEAYRASRDYWMHRIAELPPAPELPLARNAATVKQSRFVRRSARLNQESWRRFKSRASTAGLTPAAALITAFSEILARWSNHPRFTINLTLFHRQPFHPQIHELVGDFTSVELLAIDATHADSISASGRRIQEQLWTDLDHRDFSGVQVMRELARTRRAAGGFMPVVFTCDIVQGTSGEDTIPKVIPGEWVFGISQTPQVWLDHQVIEQSGSLLVNWDVLDEMFPDGLIDSMFAVNIALLERMAESDSAWGSAVRSELIPPEQLAQREIVNATEAPVPSGPLHGPFLEQCGRIPNSVAVICGEQQITYAELDEASNRIAARLRLAGTRANALVAVVMDSGWEQVAAVLGVLKSGAAFLPIDPEFPRERVQYLLDRGSVRMVLTQPWFDEHLEWPAGIGRIVVDRSLPECAGLLPEKPQNPEDLAYVIFTSGSTGRPKGVMIDHRGALNTVIDINQRFGVGSEDRVLALSALSFDLSIYDIFGLLAAGGTIVIPDAGCERDTAHWLDLLHRRRITIWNTVPALMSMLVDRISSGGGSLPDSLRLVLLSGDWIPTGLPDRINALCPGVDVVGLGGATEASIWSILYPIENVPSDWKSIPYGRPMLNQSFQVLDHALEPCPVWVPGMLYIGGVGLAQGYWRDDEKTQASFIRHPRTGERLYRTGDLGRYLPDGNIEFLGRQDFQVKIHGYRIELGEIESTLEQHPAVRSAVVTATGEERAWNGLAAHLLLDPDKLHLLYDEQADRLSSQWLKWDALEEAGLRRALELPAELEAASTLLDRLNLLSIGYMRRSLRQMGAFGSARERHTIDSLAERGRIEPRYRKVLAQWLEALTAYGLLERNGLGWFQNPEAFSGDDGDPHWEEIRQAAAASDASDLLAFLQRSGENLTRILQGALDPLEILFSGGSWTTAENLYQLNPAARYGNGIVSEIFRALAECSGPGRTLRIMELGAGIGGTTASVLPVLDPSHTTYAYTDVSTFFTSQAQRKFSQYPFVEYDLLDVNRDPQAQGFERHTFDAILAANVLHVCRDHSEGLRRVRSLLAPGGVLVMFEGVRTVPLAAITIAFLEGLGGYSDNQDASGQLFLAPDQWKQLALEAGFEQFSELPRPGFHTEALGLKVLLARASDTALRFNRSALSGFVADRLPGYMTPGSFHILDAFPLTANGKVDRQALRDSGKRAPRRAKAYAPPRTPTEEMLAQLWAEVLHLEQVGINDNFIEIGGDSLLGLQLVSKAAEMGLRLNPRELFERQTIAELAPLIDRERLRNVGEDQPEPKPAQYSPLVKIRGGNDSPPLFLVHPSTGNIDCYREITRRMASGRAVYGLESPLLEDVNMPMARIEDSACQYLAAIQEIQTAGPYLLGGWSSGGIVAFEMAQQLHASGHTAILCLIDVGVGEFQQGDRESSATALTDMLDELPEFSREEFERLDQEAQGEYLLNKAKAAGLMPADVGMSQARPYMETSKKNVAALKEYSVRPYSGRILVLRAAERRHDASSEPSLGWGAVTCGSVESHAIPGNHFTMLRGHNAQILADRLESGLAVITAAAGGSAA